MPLKVLARFSHIVVGVDVVQFDVVGTSARLKIVIDLKDNSRLFAREVVLRGLRMKYAYHWQDAAGRLLTRWDNAAHWPDIETAPHHKHVTDEKAVEASDATTLEEVLTVIEKRLRNL